MAKRQSDAGNALSNYQQGAYYCEMAGRADKEAIHTQKIRRRLARITTGQLRQRASQSERELFNLGITFTVYSDREAIDRVLPFDVIPRILSAKDWQIIESGVAQRVRAINLFLHDVYHEGKVFRDRIIPRRLVVGNANYRPEMRDIKLRHGTYVQIAGIDVVRNHEGSFHVLEDNVRTPSGVSYVVENRHLMQRSFPDLMENVRVKPVSDYGVRLRQALNEVAPAGVRDPQVVLLSAGVFNSAYFEHIFLAREMGAPLVVGDDLVIDDDRVYMKTTAGLERVDVIYRRINDDFLDPEVFRADSMLGVPGLMRAYAKGNVALANAVGTGVADDKAVYAYIPRIIKYYLDEEPILANVETHICGEKTGLAYTLDNLSELVVKPVGEAGGVGVVIGPRASSSELADLRRKLRHDPKNYISQPMVQLSVCPTLVDAGVEARHVDLRPFAVTGKDTWVLPGGLTRVALKKNSLIVNSSQGGGTKDTWVFD